MKGSHIFLLSQPHWSTAVPVDEVLISLVSHSPVMKSKGGHCTAEIAGPHQIAFQNSPLGGGLPIVAGSAQVCLEIVQESIVGSWCDCCALMWPCGALVDV